MKKKDDKLQLVKQLLDDDDIGSAIIIPQKEQIPTSTAKVFSDTETRTSRKVAYSIMFSFKLS